jgi:hypothetical protein
MRTKLTKWQNITTLDMANIGDTMAKKCWYGIHQATYSKLARLKKMRWFPMCVNTNVNKNPHFPW